MNQTIDNIIQKMGEDSKYKEAIMRKLTHDIKVSYSDKISDKTAHIKRLEDEKISISKHSKPSLSDTKKVYSIDRSIELIKSDIEKLNTDMDNDINKLYVKESTYSRTNNQINLDKIDQEKVKEALAKLPNNESYANLFKITDGTTDNSIKNNDETVKTIYKPWDRRMYRAFVDSHDNNGVASAIDIIPYNIEQSNVSTYGFFPTNNTLNKYLQTTDGDKKVAKIKEEQAKAQSDVLNQGVYSAINPYAIMTLYGSNGGEYLMDKKKRRSWYEVDNVRNQSYGFSKNPTTSNIIAWGNADPYNRTPYQFSDFVLNKYWNEIPNNRLITLRRYAAPVLDNLNFPGMDGVAGESPMGGVLDESYQPSDNTEASTSSKVQFSPVSTAITYFGDETSNKLSSILKFSSGVPWEDLKADVWKPEAPDPGRKGFETSLAISGLLGKLNIFGGNWDFDAAMRKGNGVPDPYDDGPYANRIVGPVNAINSVKKRKQGIDFKMDGLNIVFEYKARPIGGVNSKAIMLDILSNFLVMGTSNAVFFGGAHRFLSSPKGYPFLGGDAGMQAFYRGNPVKFAGSLIQEATSNGINIFGGISDMMGKIWSAVKNFNISSLFSSAGEGKSGTLLSNVSREYLASRSTDTIPHLRGMRALLIGEPVGEWHLTIGNPMNPIALIGNLICKEIECEVGDELGPDDFPLDIKVTVKLEHGMARDKDAIQSIFNRGYGRVYALPDKFATSADYNTYVDKETKNDGGYYTSDDIMSGVQIASKGQMLGAKTKFSIQDNVLQGQPSVWNRMAFDVGTERTDLTTPSINNRTIYRSNRWIAESGLR